MQQDLSRYWQIAKEQEVLGNVGAAQAVYESIIRLEPGHPIAWIRLSELARQSGRYRVSHAHALRAASLIGANGRWKSLPYVIQQLLGFGEFDLIGRLVAHADWSSSSFIEQSAVLAQGLWLANQYDIALRLIDHATSKASPSHLLAVSRGNVLKYLGRMQEATDAYELSLAINPHYANAHWSLAYHMPSDPLGSRVDRIKAAQRALPDATMDQVYLGYAMFKELDDLGDVDQAWAALMGAARLMRKRIAHDSIREKRGFDALKEATARPWTAPSSMDGNGRTPIFIVGMPRSGTTVLDRILSSHSDVASAGELNEFSNAVSWVSDHDYSVPAVEDSIRSIRNIDFVQVGAHYMRRTDGYYAGKSHLIDKNPANVFNAAFIAKALPRAKIICLVRDPMDACFSNFKELFSENVFTYSYDLVELADHHAEFERLVAHWQGSLSDRFHVVRYEELVANPVATAESVMRFCGLSFQPECVDITRNQNPVSTASSSQVRVSINARSVGAWQRYAAYLQPLQARLQTASR